MPQVQAFTGVGNALKVFNASFADTFLDTTISFNITSDGVMQSFLAICNIKDFSAVSGAVQFTIKRNGDVVSRTIADMGVLQTTTGATVVFYETLNFLAGAEVYAGEVFSLEMDVQSTGGSCNLNGVMTMVVKTSPKAFVIP